MFELLFSISGAVKRKEFLIGLTIAFVMTWLSFFMWAFITVMMFKHWGVTGDILVSLKEIEKNSPANYNLILQYETLFTPFFSIVSLAVIGWCKLCLIVKRLRDLDVNPWTILAPISLYVVVFEVGLQKDPGSQFPLNIIGVACMLLILAFYLALLCCPSRLKN